MSSPPRTRALHVVFVLLVAMAGIVSLVRALEFRFDFHHFYLDAEYVWNHAALNPDLDHPDPARRRQLPFYLPAVPLLLAPLGALGRTGAAVVWALLQAGSLAAALILLRRWATELAGGSAESLRAALLAWLLAAPALFEAARFNQLSTPLLALLLFAFERLRKRRSRSAGALLGSAAVLKLLPAIFVVWLLQKRLWWAGLGWAVGGASLALLPCLLCFGPRLTWQYHAEWFDYNFRGAAATGMTDPSLRAHFIDHRNQSLPSVVARLCWREHPHPAPLRLASLSLETCRRVGLAMAALLAAALLLATARPADQLSAPRRQAEFALYLLAMLILSPLVRQYYLVWALPALQCLAGAAVHPAASRARRFGRAGLAVWVLGMLLWMLPAARLLGVHLAMLVVLALLLLGAFPAGYAGITTTGDGPSSSGSICAAKPQRPSN